MKNKGFTLLELMTVLLVVAIIASIAVSSYQSHLIRNAENEAKEKLLELAPALREFRAKNLKGYDGFALENAPSNKLYVGGDASAADHLYSITVELQKASWKASATPNTSSMVLKNGGYSYALFSSMDSCQTLTRNDTLDITSLSDCSALIKWKR